MQELVPIEINLNAANKLDESFLVTFARLAKGLLKGLFTDAPTPVKIKGTASQVSAFTRAIEKEKKYMDAYIKYGLNDQRTLSTRHLLNRAVESFEKETGMRWPFTG